MEQKAVSDPQVVQAGASLPRAATADSFAQAIWAPQPTRSSRTAAFGQTDMAAQIRSKFENLVRASPLPKASLPSCLGVRCPRLLHAVVYVADVVLGFPLVNKLFSSQGIPVCAGCRTAYQPR